MGGQRLRALTAVAAAALTVGAVAAGCGNTGVSATDRHLITASSSRSLLDQATHAMLAQKSAHLVVAVGSLGRAVGDVSYAGSSPRLAMSTTHDGRTMRLRLVDGAAYLSVPPLTPAGKYLEVTKGTPVVGPMLAQLRNFTPSQTVKALRKGVTQMRDLGTTTIDGQTVRHYRVSVDLAKVAGATGLTMPPGHHLPTSVTDDLYISQRHLVRRAVVTVGGHKVTVDATKWGEPVHVQAPPKSDVITHLGMAGAGSTAS